MILDKEIITNISHWNIEYYKTKGYIDIKCNQKLKILVEDLPTESNLKINVKCDICGKEKIIAYQKYNKNIRNYNIYTCDSSCAQIKNKLTLKEKYGSENFNRSEENKIKVKEKYDKITQEHEERGYINCKICNKDKCLEDYGKNRNNRYQKACLECKAVELSKRRKQKRISQNEKYRKRYKEVRSKNKHLHAWRQILKNYLASKGLSKNNKTLYLLKYTQDDLKIHLELKFESDMNWSNHGKVWHIDHIIPVSLFKIDTPIDLVNSLENLRPVYKSYNISKGNRIDDEGLKIIDKFKTYIDEKYIIYNKNK
jgi:hypothetical protein